METLQVVWAELGARIRRFVGRRVEDPHAADDVAQDVMLKVYAQLDALPPGDRLDAWVFRVARNAVIDYYRARGVREHAGLAQAEALAGDDAEQQQALRDLAPCLARMVAQLPEPYREAMRLADFDGLGQQEVADRLGISLSGAKSRVQRARRQLREMILDCCDLERDGRGGVADYRTTERSPKYCGEGPKDGGCRGG